MPVSVLLSAKGRIQDFWKGDFICIKVLALGLLILSNFSLISHEHEIIRPFFHFHEIIWPISDKIISFS